jgi:hypothetical protein
MRCAFCCALGLSAVAGPGCNRDATTNADGTPARPVYVPPNARTDAINLYAQPVAVNFDQTPGPDGFGLRLYLFRRAEEFAVPCRAGELVFDLYEGRVASRDIRSADRFYQWRFSADQLRRFETRSLIGVGYALLLDWGDRPPTTDVVTLVVRHELPDGHKTYAAPIALSVMSQ